MATAVWLVFVIMLQIASGFFYPPGFFYRPLPPRRVFRKIVECIYIIAHTFLHLVQSTLCVWKVLS